MNESLYDACAEFDMELQRYRYLLKFLQDTERLGFPALPQTRKLLTATCVVLEGCLERMGWADEIIGF